MSCAPQGARRIAVNLVSAGEDENGLRRMLTRRLKQVERAGGIDVEVGKAKLLGRQS